MIELELQKLSKRLARVEELLTTANQASAASSLGVIAFINWASKRETLEPNDHTYYVYEESYIKAEALLEPLRNHISSKVYPLVFNSLVLHYVITTPYEFIDEQGNTAANPLYEKYNIAAKGLIISSASDESSSSSMHITKSLQDGDFLMQDLMRTKYGEYVYSILEQLDVSAVLL